MFIRQLTKNTYNDLSFSDIDNKVIIETPYAGNIEYNSEFTKACVRDSLINHNENPQCLHLIYPKIINDEDTSERSLGLGRSFAIHKKANRKIYYLDRGFTEGMREGFVHAIDNGIPVEFRCLSKDKKVQQFIDYANSLTVNPDNALKFIVSNIERLKDIALPVGSFGDYTRFRIDSFLDIEAIEKAGFQEKYFKIEDRVFMRKLLLETEHAPLMPEMLHHQIFKPELAIKMRSKMSSWNQACDGFAVLVDGMSFNDLFTVYYQAKSNNKFVLFKSLDNELNNKLVDVSDVKSVDDILRSHGRINQDFGVHKDSIGVLFRRDFREEFSI